MAGWMLNCKEYAEIISRSLDRPLSLWERMSMKMHQLLCPPCHLVRKQFEAIRHVCRMSFPDDLTAGDKDNQLSKEACDRIKAAIAKETEDLRSV